MPSHRFDGAFGQLPEKDKFGICKIVIFADANQGFRVLGKEFAVAKRSEEEKKILNEILPNVSLQIRMSLSVLHSGMQRVMKSNPSAPGLAQMNQGYHQLLRLAGNLSAAEMLSDPGWKLDKCNNDIAILCKRLSRRVQPLAEDRGIHFCYEAPWDSYIIEFDQNLIERLVLNLISNAVKFSSNGDTVTLSLRVADGSVLLSVSDTGRGIAVEKMEHLFDRYQNISNMDPTPYGFGLGLPLCRSIAEAHGGRIFAESQEGVGTKVTVALPDRESIISRLRDVRYEYAGGFDHVMVEMSDALASTYYHPRLM